MPNVYALRPDERLNSNSAHMYDKNCSLVPVAPLCPHEYIPGPFTVSLPEVIRTGNNTTTGLPPSPLLPHAKGIPMTNKRGVNTVS